jgi:uncharacterized damage-inducible protein DinB
MRWSLIGAPRDPGVRRLARHTANEGETTVDALQVLIELFDRIPEHVREAVEGLSTTELTTAPELGSNTIGWLVWHLSRVQDHHVAELLGDDQVWQAEAWPRRFGLTPDPANTGYGHTPREVEGVRPRGADALLEYYAAVAARTRTFLRRLTEQDLDRVVDERWDPPVTLGVRLVSIADDDIQHAGQAKYLRGLLARRR